MDQSPSPKNMMFKMASLMLGLLSLEFVLGMISNLYVQFPDTKDQAKLMEATWKHWATASHAILGLLIVVLGVVLVVKGVKSKQRMLSTLSIVGFIAVLVAAVGGDLFVRMQQAGYSLLMSIGFIAAMGIYGRFMGVAMMEQPKSQL